MQKSNTRSSVFTVTVLLVVLLVLSLGTTIALAYFHKSKEATTTINFRNDVALTVSSVDGSDSGIALTGTYNGNWQRKVDAESSWGVSGNASTSLTMSGLKVKDASGDNTSVFVRLFVAIQIEYVGDTAPTIPSIPVASGTTTTTVYTTKETAFIASLGGEHKTTKYIAITIPLNATANQYTNLIEDYSIFTSDRGNEWQHSNIDAMCVITANVNNTDWESVSNSVSYTFTLG